VYRRSLMFVPAMLLLLFALAAQAAVTETRKAYLADINGAIGPATADYITRTLDEAESRQMDLLIIRMDTPGGLDLSMRAIVKRIIAARIPVVAYVAPGGARAASAGTYILYACHVAAMAPATNLGAATPVTLGGMPQSPSPPPEQDQERSKEQEPPPGDAKERKLINDAAAYLRSLAKLRGRNAEWAEEAVRQGASLSAAEALERGVIDLIAADLDTLLKRLDGLEVELPGGQRTLSTR